MKNKIIPGFKGEHHFKADMFSDVEEFHNSKEGELFFSEKSVTQNTNYRYRNFPSQTRSQPLYSFARFCWEISLGRRTNSINLTRNHFFNVSKWARVTQVTDCHQPPGPRGGRHFENDGNHKGWLTGR